MLFIRLSFIFKMFCCLKYIILVIFFRFLYYFIEIFVNVIMSVLIILDFGCFWVVFIVEIF